MTGLSNYIWIWRLSRSKHDKWKWKWAAELSRSIKTCVIHAHTQWQAVAVVAGNFHLDWQKDLPPKAATIIHVHVGTGAGAGAGTGSIRRRWFPCEWPKKSSMKTYGNINGQLTQKIHGKHNTLNVSSMAIFFQFVRYGRGRIIIKMQFVR